MQEQVALPGEVWAMIPFTNGNYSISSIGRVYNNKHKRYLKWLTYKSGYKYVYIYKRHYFIHRLVAHSFLGLDIHSEFVINHLDGNKANNSISNLEITNHYGNAFHAKKTGLASDYISWDVKDKRKLGIIHTRLRYITKSILKISHGEFERRTGVSRRIFYQKYDGIKQKTLDKITKVFPINPSWIKDGIGEILLH